jgi:hypothetical protein
VHRSILQSQALKHSLHHFNNTPPTHIEAPLHVVRQNRAPVTRFFIFTLKPTTLVHHSILQSQGLNPGLPHFDITPTLPLKAPLHIVRQNGAPAARFSIFSLIPTPLAHHSILWSQALNPTLPHFNNTPPTHINAPPACRLPKPSQFFIFYILVLFSYISLVFKHEFLLN